MTHIVLLGDSILDNRAYTGGGPAVIDHLRAQLAPGWAASLLATDGHVVAQALGQLERLPGDATHLVVSAGGNDAILTSGLLSEPASSVADVLLRLADVADAFASAYQLLTDALAARGLPVVLCTVYEPNMGDPTVQRLMATGLTLFNDRILRAAFQLGCSVIDLRRVCTEPADYANEIEPSVAGGAKIARAIVRAVGACSSSTTTIVP